MAARLFAQAGHQLGVGPGDSVGGFYESLPIWVFADGQEDFPNRFFNSGNVDLVGRYVAIVICLPFDSHAARSVFVGAIIGGGGIGRYWCGY